MKYGKEMRMMATLLAGYWMFFYVVHFVPGFNQRYYAIPLSDIRLRYDAGGGGGRYELIPDYDRLRAAGIKNVYITKVPILNYIPIICGVCFSMFVVVVVWWPRKIEKEDAIASLLK